MSRFWFLADMYLFLRTKMWEMLTLVGINGPIPLFLSTPNFLNPPSPSHNPQQSVVCIEDKQTMLWVAETQDRLDRREGGG